MANQTYSEPLERSVEDVIGARLHDMRSLAEQRLHQTEDYVRSEPMKAVAIACAAGYAARVLPIGSLFRSIVGLVLFAVKPAALIYGTAKAYELLKQSRSDRQLPP